MKRNPLTRLVCLLALACMPRLLIAQIPIVDSLRQELKKPDWNDSVRAEIYSQLSARVVTFDTKQAVELGLKAVDLAIKSGSRPLIGRAYGSLGLAYRNDNQLDQSLKVLNLAVTYFNNDSSSFRLGNIYMYMGSAYQKIPDFKNAAVYYMKALAIFERNEATDKKAWRNVGMIQTYLGIIDYYQKDYASALHYYKLAMKRTPDANVHTNIGTVYDALEKYDSASMMYRRASVLARHNLYYSTYIVTLENLGNVLRKQNQFDSAKYYFNLAIAVADSFALPHTKLFAFNQLAKIHFAQKDFRKAISNANSVITADSLMGENDERMEAFETLSKVYLELGDFKNAHRYLSKFIVLKDTIFAKENAARIDAMKSGYEVEKRQIEIDRLAKTNELHQANLERESTVRNFLIAIILLLILSVVLVIYNLITKTQLIARLSLQSKEILLQNNRIKSMNQVLELKTLRAQINPHFLFNALSSIQNYVIKSEKELAIEYLQKFARLIRKILDSSMVLSITLKEEIDMLNNYIELERLRFGFNFDYEIIIPEDIISESITIPYLVVQPYVENAILHGLRLKEGNGFLRIEFKQDGERLICVVDDNGVGRTMSRSLRSASSRHKSVGIAITEDRIRKIGEYTNEKVDVQIIDKEDSGFSTGTRVEIQIPLMQLNAQELYQ